MERKERVEKDRRERWRLINRRKVNKMNRKGRTKDVKSWRNGEGGGKNAIKE